MVTWRALLLSKISKPMSLESLHDKDYHWVACHTMPRCEKKLATALQVDQIEHELPLVESVRKYGRRTKSFTKPLFPGYLFARLPLGVPLRPEQLTYLYRTLPVENEARFLEQLDAIRRLLDSGLTLTLHPLLKKGSRVRVIAGPLWGLDGVVEQPSSPKGVVISVDILRQGVLVPITPEHLKLLEE